MKQPAIIQLAAGFTVGVAALSWWPVGAVVSLVAAIWLRNQLTKLVVVGILLGLLRIGTSPLLPEPDSTADLIGRTVTLEATVVGLPDRQEDRQRFTIATPNQSGKVLVTTGRKPEVAPGDRLTVSGQVKRPPVFPDFDYRSWLAKDETFATMSNARISNVTHRGSISGALWHIRLSFTNHLQAAIPSPAGDFLRGIILGDRSGLSDEVHEDFRRTGTTHVLALSGYNISILIGVLVGILGRRRASLIMSIVGVVGFVALVGPSASVVRAALSGGFIVLGQLLGRPQAAIRACLITAAAMLLWKPWALRYDLGFDLSFAATLGILLLERPIRTRLGWLPAPIRPVVSPTLAASLPTIPILMLNFGSFSAVSPLANAVVVPLIPWLMLGGVLTVTASYINSALAVGPAWLTGTVANGLIGLVGWLADQPGAAITLTTGRATVAMVLAIGCGLLAWRLHSYSRGSPSESG